MLMDFLVLGTKGPSVATTPDNMLSSTRQPGMTSAEARFESAQKVTRTLRELEAKSVAEKTARLRALRLLRDADELAMARDSETKAALGG